MAMFGPGKGKKDLEAIGCGDPDCTEDHEVIYFHATCHPHAKTWAFYHKGAGLLGVECGECGKRVISVRVAEWPAGDTPSADGRGEMLKISLSSIWQQQWRSSSGWAGKVRAMLHWRGTKGG